MNEVWKERKTHLLQFWKLNCTDKSVFYLFHDTHYRYDRYIRLNEGEGKEEDICGSPQLDAVIRQILFWLRPNEQLFCLWEKKNPASPKNFFVWNDFIVQIFVRSCAADEGHLNVNTFLSKWGGQLSGDNRQEKYSMYPHLACSLFMNTDGQHVV